LDKTVDADMFLKSTQQIDKLSEADESVIEDGEEENFTKDHNFMKGAPIG